MKAVDKWNSRIWATTSVAFELNHSVCPRTNGQVMANGFVAIYYRKGHFGSATLGMKQPNGSPLLHAVNLDPDVFNVPANLGQAGRVARAAITAAHELGEDEGLIF